MTSTESDYEHFYLEIQGGNSKFKKLIIKDPPIAKFIMKVVTTSIAGYIALNSNVVALRVLQLISNF